jgi:predicted transposase/invertase (TIGR01784 family)
VIADDEIMQHQRVALLELVQKHIRTRDVQEIIEHLATLLLKGYTTDKQVRSLMEYILQVGETGDFKTLITTLATQVPEHEETLMTIAEQLRQEGETHGLLRGRQEGRQEGEQIGREKAQLDMAKKMLSSGAESSYILEMTGLTAEQLTKLVN